MADGGVIFDESMAVRFIEIPVNREFGVFDDVPAAASPADYADLVRDLSRRYYGAPIHEFLSRLTTMVTEDRDGVVDYVNARIASMRKRLDVDRSNGQQSRVADYFTLAYAAGAFAIKESILPVTKHQLRASIADVYRSHTEAQGVLDVDSDPISSLRARLEKLEPTLLDLRGAANVTDSDIVNAPGYIMGNQSSKEFVFTPGQFQQLLSHRYSLKRTCDALRHKGLLIRDAGGKKESLKNQTKRRLGQHRQRVYCIPGRILEPDDSNEPELSASHTHRGW
jgi:putative DNA primase/helicase